MGIYAQRTADREDVRRLLHFHRQPRRVELVLDLPPRDAALDGDDFRILVEIQNVIECRHVENDPTLDGGVTSLAMLLSSNQCLQLMCRRERQRLPHLLFASYLNNFLTSVGFNLLTSFEATGVGGSPVPRLRTTSAKQSVAASMLEAAHWQRRLVSIA